MEARLSPMRTFRLASLWNVWEQLIGGYQTAFVPLENLYRNNASVKALLQQIVIEAALLLAPPCNTTIQSLDNGKINGGQFYKYVLCMEQQRVL